MGVVSAKQKQDFGYMSKIQSLWQIVEKAPNPQRGAMKWNFTPSK
jgi:hypothetical protein